MKYLFIGCLLAFFGLTTVNAQTWQTPLQAGGSYTPFQLKSVYFISATQGWTVGNHGTILTTNNGGINWTAQTSGTSNDLTSVYFTSASQGWAVGYNGTIITTSNGGINWTAQTSGTTQPLYSVHFTSPTQGWAVGGGNVVSGTILTTINGGSTWTVLASNLLPINSIFFTSSMQGWAVGSGGVIRTTSNGGSTWTTQTSGTTDQLNSVYFLSPTQGWAVGFGGTIITTSNGGNTWTAQTSGTTNYLTSVYFTSATLGWAVGQNGTILTTNNGGNTWTVQISGITEVLTGVFFTSATQGWVVGSSGATVLNTSNGGSTWDPQTSGTTQILNSIYFTSATQGWVVGGGGTGPYGIIFTTNNGGSTWTGQITGSTFHEFKSVYFTSGSKGWVVGGIGIILTTNNGGNTWTTQTSGTTKALTSVYFNSATKGCVVGDSGIILTTINGGNTWTAQTSGTTNSLTSVYFISATQGWAVGYNGTILTTNNGGSTWTIQTSGTTNTLTSVYFNSATQGWAVGYGGTILTTSNGGITWTAQISGNSQPLTSVYFTSPTKGWVAGLGGIILTTNNGGTTWTIYNSGIISGFNSLFFKSPTQGWAAGIGNVLLYGGACNPSTNTLNINACDSFTWVDKGNTVYTSSNNTDTIHLTNVAGCDSIVTLNLTIKQSSTSTTNLSICSNDLPYTWNGLTFNAADSQTYHTTNAGGCDSAATLNLTVNTATNNSTSVTACNSYTWNANNQTYTTSGTYQVVTGCHTETLNLTINQGPTVTAPANTTVCAGTSVTLSGSGAASYTWDNGITNGVAFPATATTTYTVTGTSNGCSNTAQTTLTVNPLPNVNAGADKTICPGTATSLTATGAVSYSWSGGITNGTTFTPIATTTYVVTGTNANNCFNTDTVVVNVRYLGIVAITPVICKGVADTLTAPTGTNYVWKKNGNVMAGKTTRSIYVSVVGNYTVTYTDSLCGVKTLPVIGLALATPPAKPIISATKLTICPNDTTTLYADVVAFKYIWLLNSSTSILSGVTNRNYHISIPGTYYVKAVDSFGCRSIISGAKVIKAGTIPIPVVTIVNATLGSKKLTCTNSGTYQWRLNGNNIAGATSNKYIATQTGAYSVRLTNSTGCVAISPDTTLTINYTGPKMNQEALTVMNNQEDIKVYPNPSEGIFYIEATEATKAFVTDLQGRKVLETTNTHQVDISNNPSGIYFLQLMNEEGMLLKTEKLMKQ